MRALDQQALKLGIIEALGVPAAVLGAGFLGYGSLVADAGYSVWMMLMATFAIWALPGQLVLLEMAGGGAALTATVFAVSLSAARFLPMTLTLMVLMRERSGGRRLWHFLVAAQLVSMTTWAVAMQRFSDPHPKTATEHALRTDIAARWYYFVGFSTLCISAAAICGVIGVLLIGALPPLARFGLALLTPLYFFVTLVGEARSRMQVLALLGGAISALVLQTLSSNWSLLGAGLIGGTIAWWCRKPATPKPTDPPQSDAQQLDPQNSDHPQSSQHTKAAP